MVVRFDHRVAARNDHLGLLLRWRMFRVLLARVGQAAHDQAHVHLGRQVDLAHLAAHHARALAVATRHDLQRLGHAPAQAVHSLHIALPHIGQQLAQHGLRGRQRNVDLRAVHQVGIAAPVDQRQHAACAHALGQQARHDVVLVIAGDGQEQVDVLDALAAQQLLIGRIALQHQHVGGQLGRQLHAAIRIDVDDLDVQVALLGELPGQPRCHAPPARHHDAAHRARHLPARAMERRQHPGDLLAPRQHEHLVARLHHGRTVAGDETIRLVRKPPVDGDDAHRHVGRHQPQRADAVPHHGRATTRAHRHQACPAARKLAHLHGFGKLDELADVARQRFLGADDAVHAEAVLAQQLLGLVQPRRTHPRDQLGHVEHHLRHLAAHQIGLVLRRAGNQQIGVVGAGLGQHLRVDAIAHHAAQVVARLQLAQALRVLVDHRDVVAFRFQAVGHAGPHPARAQDDDLHGFDFPPRVVPCQRGRAARARPLPAWTVHAESAADWKCAMV
ncbi:hypothetical protein SDC9_78195 [bioreactor metagenome]|uniref:Uncharacterized protein n=1 Tax=bioreactor metagenome TaxID=1076179 RepID=A0A644YTJ4_9ZZZZ